MKSAKKLLIALLVCSMLVLGGCSRNPSENTADPAPSEQESSQSDEPAPDENEEDEAVPDENKGEETAPDENTEESDEVSTDKDKEPSDQAESAGTLESNADSFLYENSELGFSIAFPSCVEDKVKFEPSTRDANGETINVISVVYQGESGEANILMLEEMSSQMWEQMQQENGPQPVELGSSEAGRVVVMYPLQSNPYEMGTDDAQVIDQFAEERSVISQSFAFDKN